MEVFRRCSTEDLDIRLIFGLSKDIKGGQAAPHLLRTKAKHCKIFPLLFSLRWHDSTCSPKLSVVRPQSKPIPASRKSRAIWHDQARIHTPYLFHNIKKDSEIASPPKQRHFGNPQHVSWTLDYPALGFGGYQKEIHTLWLAEEEASECQIDKKWPNVAV